ncbi:2-keto-4-pentenoate hydratase [Kyrpidia sp.]|uniref:2-keto-4-pentenoate hydratase n=1 Tax=Kyrpidia sp. TaxID=2073077 RepID=UPI002589577B|nr:2-keto-4-pentenoate hydratase [Kyrpidia sp.]MCL6577405.1 2-keto-4-pentenoate hydratase [Kyrpidia sp.]
MHPERVEKWAKRLLLAEQDRSPIPPLTEQEPGVTVEEAYQIQLALIHRKLAAGDGIVGHKIGLTSRPMQEMMGVREPDYGHLLKSMQYPSGVPVKHPLLQPRVEAEIAFVLKKELKGPGLGLHDVLQATEYVVPAIEIVDSRIENWRIRLPDTVADNASSGCFVLGNRPTRVTDAGLERVGMVLYENGEMVQTGTGAAVLGHPAMGVAWLANKLAEFGTILQPGHVVLSGAISAAVTVKAGAWYTASFGRLGFVDTQVLTREAAE